MTDTWTQLMGGPDHLGYVDSTLIPPLHLAWKYPFRNSIHSSPVIADGRVYMAAPYEVVALDLHTGEHLWRVKGLGTLGETTPAIWRNSLVLRGTDGIFVLDCLRGTVQQHISTSYTRSSVCVANDKVSWCGRGAIWVADLPSGALRWHHSFQDLSGYFPPAMADGIVYGLNDTVLYALDVDTGQLRWQWLYPPASARGTIGFDAGTIYLVLQEQGLFALNSQTGTVQWDTRHNNQGLTSAPCVAPDLIYVAGGARLYAFDRRDGTISWVAERPPHDSWPNFYTFMESAPISIGDHLYIGGGNLPMLYGFNRHTGEQLWEVEMTPERYAVFSTCAYADGYLLIGCHDGYLYCFTQIT